MDNGTVTPRMLAAWAETIAETTETDTATLVIYLGFMGNLHWTDTEAVLTPLPVGVTRIVFDVTERTFRGMRVTFAGTLVQEAVDAALGAPASRIGATAEYRVSKKGGTAHVSATFDGDAPQSQLTAATLLRG
jgi:hypothetical protein